MVNNNRNLHHDLYLHLLLVHAIMCNMNNSEDLVFACQGPAAEYKSNPYHKYGFACNMCTEQYFEKGPKSESNKQTTV